MQESNTMLQPERIIASGYQAERHHVITEDGYILEMHRIPFGRGQNNSAVRRPAVLLMHGLMSASDAFIALGPDYSIGYNLADAGFDVWMGNARGNRLSRRHVSLDPNHSRQKFDFFDFSWEEIGKIDVPAMVDYILEFTNQQQLHYVGHSQGGTVFLVLASMRPEYNAKFRTVHLLAGTGYKDYFPNTLLRLTALGSDTIYATALSIGFVEVFPPIFDSILPWSSTDVSPADQCTGRADTMYICEAMGMRELLSKLGNERRSVLNFGGAAVKQIVHYGQIVRDKAFRRWNYGVLGNIRRYGSVSPPSYDLSRITARVTMHYTINDFLLDERDVLNMARDMPNCEARRVTRDTFLHEDFAEAKDVKELVTDYMIESMWREEDQSVIS